MSPRSSIPSRLAAAVLLLGTLGLGACRDEGEDPDHGYVRVQLRRAPGQTESPFAGTTEIELIMVYETCLQDFYANQPNWAADGVDGAPVFAEFADNDSDKSLCRQTDPTRGVVPCTVEEIDQRLDSSRLQATYRVENADAIEDRVLFLGPIPCEKITNCRPIMTISGGTVRGRAGATTLWQLVTVENTSVAACEPGAPIDISVGMN